MCIQGRLHLLDLTTDLIQRYMGSQGRLHLLLGQPR